MPLLDSSETAAPRQLRDRCRPPTRFSCESRYPPEQLEGDTLRLYNQYRMALEAVQRRAPASAAAAPEAPPPPPPALDAYEQGRERIIIRRVGAERGARGGPSRSYVRTS